MILFNVEIQEVFGGEISTALNTPVDMRFVVMYFVFIVWCKGDGLAMWGERT
jgi:hypothetical protein